MRPMASSSPCSKRRDRKGSAACPAAWPITAKTTSISLRPFINQVIAPPSCMEPKNLSNHSSTVTRPTPSISGRVRSTYSRKPGSRGAKRKRNFTCRRAAHSGTPRGPRRAPTTTPTEKPWMPSQGSRSTPPRMMQRL